MGSLQQLRKELMSHADPLRSEHSKRFFKTGPGQYGEGDVFLGIAVPVQRKVAKGYLNLTYGDLQALLDSSLHEERFVALVILVSQYSSANEKEKSDIYDFYMKNIHRINNWDLVDSSSPQIVGATLFKRDKQILFNMVKSEDLWTRRVAVLATFYFIRNGEYQTIISLAELLLHDTQDLMHKAVGWMLREMGKRNNALLIGFLDKHATSMPRTMLRYAIEKLSNVERQKYMKAQKI